jgi:hypothetical protein
MAVAAGCVVAAAVVLVLDQDTSVQALCTALGQQGGAPPGDRHPFLTSQVIATGQRASDRRLRAGATALALAGHQNQPNAINSAEGKVQVACVRLGDWHVYL